MSYKSSQLQSPNSKMIFVDSNNNQVVELQE